MSEWGRVRFRTQKFGWMDFRVSCARRVGVAVRGKRGVVKVQTKEPSLHYQGNLQNAGSLFCFFMWKQDGKRQQRHKWITELFGMIRVGCVLKGWDRRRRRRSALDVKGTFWVGLASMARAKLRTNKAEMGSFVRLELWVCEDGRGGKGYKWECILLYFLFKNKTKPFFLKSHFVWISGGFGFFGVIVVFCFCFFSGYGSSFEAFVYLPWD